MKTKCQAHKLRRVLACVVMLASLLFISTLGSSYAQSEQPPTQEPAQPAETGDEEMPLPTHTPSEPQPEPQDEPPRAPLPADAPIYTAGVDRYVATTGTDSGNCTASPCKTVAYAVSQAVSGDTIHIAAGTYYENIILYESLMLSGAGINQTFLDGMNNDRVISHLDTQTATINNLTIQNGKGGIYSHGDMTLQNVKLIKNHADTYGGGIYILGNLTMTDVWISENSAAIACGGIDSSGTINMLRVKVSKNRSGYGGAGGISARDNTSMTDVEIIDNETNGVGGGIRFDLDGTESAMLKRLTISGNKANYSGLYGGGLHIQQSSGSSGVPTVDLINVTISGNSAASYGSAMTVSLSFVRMQNVTITNNTGLSTAIFSTDGSIHFKNSIVSNNSGGNCNKSGGATFLSNGNNIDSLEFTNDFSCAFDQASDQSATDSLLLPLADNGGFTLTHALPQNSPAVDAGTNSGCPTTDQRGVTRPWDGNSDGTATCDIGSFEFKHPISTQTFTSNSTYDGWVLESARTSSKGGSLNKGAVTLSVGDDAGNRQYRGILHFNTTSLPDTAVITSVKLQVRRAGYKGTNPFTTHGALYVDLRKGAFSNNAALQAADWQAAASKSAAGKIPKTSASNWHTLNLSTANFNYINKTGMTQLRLRFAKQDNGDNGADYVNFYSGNAVAANRPKLIITYYVP